MSDSKKSLADRLLEKSQSAKDAMKRGAEVVADGAQKGGAALAQGAQGAGEALAQGAHKGADVLAQGAEKGGQVIAQGAKIAGEGAQKGAQFVKEHPKETAIVAGAAVVAAGALPFTPFGVPAAITAVSAVAKGAKATQEALQGCGVDGVADGDGNVSGALGLIAAAEAGASVAETTLGKLNAGKSSKQQ